MKRVLCFAALWMTLISSVGSYSTVAAAETLCIGVQVKPRADLRTLIDSHAEGTTFCLSDGTYRPEQPLRPKNGQRFIGVSEAIISGSQVVDDFRRDATGYWTTAWIAPKPTLGGECDHGYTGCAYADDVFLDNVRLWRVTSLSDLRPGAAYIDYGARQLYLAEDPGNSKVEVAIAPYAFGGSARNVEIRGLVIEKFANNALGAGAINSLSNWLILRNEVRLNHGAGIAGSNGARVIDNYVHHNGQYGFKGTGIGSSFEGNEVSFNNTAGFDGGAAGGSKWMRTKDLVVRNNYFHHNHGAGIWVDNDNYNALIQDNVTVDNAGHGIHYEVSYNAVIRNNRSANNGAWGILVTSSPNVEVFGNEISNNGIGGILLQQTNRGTGAFGPHLATNNSVHDNTITMRSGFTGARSAVNDNLIYGNNNRFARNNYRLANLAGKYFLWNRTKMVKDQWVRLGHDTAGSFSQRR